MSRNFTDLEQTAAKIQMKNVGKSAVCPHDKTSCRVDY